MSKSIPLNDKKTIKAWAFFDWANSAFVLVVGTAVFPSYFENVAPKVVDILGQSFNNSVLLSYAVSFSFLLIAAISPLLSGIADYGGKRLFFLKFFTIIGSIFCAALFFFTSAKNVWWGMTAYVISNIGFAGSIVFYNAYLPEIVTEDRYDKVSAKGYAYGYFGSVLLLFIILFMVMQPHVLGLADAGIASRIGFVMVGLWWIGFAQITFNKMPKDKGSKITKEIMVNGYREMIGVFNIVKKDKNIKMFLTSFFFYIAGVNTIVYLANIFAVKELGFETAELIIVVLLLQLVAIGGAYLFAYVSKLYGNKKSLIIQIVIWMLICFVAYFTTGKTFFYVLSGFVGLVLGGIQSLSRSSYTKLLDDDIDDITSFYSFYDVVYKLGVVSGTFLFGFVEMLTNNMRYSILVLTLLFFIGLLFMLKVKFGDNSQGELAI